MLQAVTIVLVKKKKNYNSKEEESKLLCGSALGNPSFVVPAYCEFQPLGC